MTDLVETTLMRSEGENGGRVSLPFIFAVMAALGLIFYVFVDGLAYMAEIWQHEEYSHGYMIPLVAALMAWQRLPRLFAAPVQGSFTALPLLLAGLVLYLLGELSTIYTLIQYGFVLALWGLVVALWGLRGVRVLWPALLYLIFMIPLPVFLYNSVSGQLQLLSSELGVGFLRLVGVSVFLEGNVIDLGSYQLQVVEACSGLRYLFPLMSFGFLVAYLYRGPAWFKVLIFLSTLPITLLMNSLRIGVIGVTVDRWGIGMAEGFLHAFEGWFIFLACLLVLFAEIWLIGRFVGSKRPFRDRFDLDLPSARAVLAGSAKQAGTPRPLYACLGFLLAAAPLAWAIDTREEQSPQRTPFTRFPLLHEQWLGREVPLDAQVLESLQLTDHYLADYRHPEYAQAVNLYLAYYGSQRKGASVHSPQSCIPGGGWEIESLREIDLAGLYPNQSLAVPLKANRVVIRKGPLRQVVYYWLQQRGRILTNAYAAKWFIFWDSITRGRTDGALVRFVLPVPEGAEIEAADAQLVHFIRDFYPLTAGFIPE